MQKPATNVPLRQIRALYDADTLRVYQAYSESIADAALAHGTFVSPPFKMERMTWIKPSFLWMMYRAGWGYKDPGQARILAHSMHWLVEAGDLKNAYRLLPREQAYPLPLPTP